MSVYVCVRACMYVCVSARARACVFTSQMPVIPEQAEVQFLAILAGIQVSLTALSFRLSR